MFYSSEETPIPNLCPSFTSCPSAGPSCQVNLHPSSVIYLERARRLAATSVTTPGVSNPSGTHAAGTLPLENLGQLKSILGYNQKMIERSMKQYIKPSIVKKRWTVGLLSSVFLGLMLSTSGLQLKPVGKPSPLLIVRYVSLLRGATPTR